MYGNCSLLLLFLVGVVFRLSAQADLEARVDSFYAIDDYVGVAETYRELSRLSLSEDALLAGDYALAAAEFWAETDKAEEALVDFRWVQKLSLGETAVDSIRALAFHLEGLYHHRGDDYPAAFKAYRQSIDLRDQTFPQGHNDRAKTRYNLGTAYRQHDMLDSAAFFLEASNEHYGSLLEPDTLRWIRALTSLGLVYGEQNDAQLLGSASARAVGLARRFYRDRPDRIASVYYLSAQGFFLAQQPAKAIEYGQGSLEFARLADDVYQEGDALSLIAGANLDRGDYQSALSQNLQLLELWKDQEVEPHELSILYHNLGLCYARLGRLGEAEVATRKSLAGNAAIKDSFALARSYELLGFVERESGHYEVAESHFQNALRYLGRENTLLESPEEDIPPAELKLLADIAEDRAQLYRQTDRLDQALSEYEIVFSVLDRIRLDLGNEESQRYVSQRLRPFFQRAVHLRYLLYQRDGNEDHLWQALILSERSKAFSLLLSTMKGKEDRPRRERELLREIARLERNQSNETNEQSLATARLELARLKGLRTDAGQQLSVLDPIALRDLLADLNLNLFEYALGDEKSYLFRVTSTGDISAYPLGPGESFSELVDQLRESLQASAYKQISVRENQAELDLDFTGAAFTTFSYVFPAGAAEGVPPGNWLIIPDGVLGFLPFGALLTEEVSGQVNYADLPYLQRDRFLHYSYSAQYLLELEERSTISSKLNLLALAPSFRGANSPGGVRSAVTNSRGERAVPGLLPLRYNTEEVVRIAELLPLVDAYLNEEATRNRFEAMAADYRILHLSSHALVNADDPNKSFVAFAQMGDSLETEEMLFLNDLYAMSLDAELAVLSACETNIGEYSPGEGVLSLARAFAQAGARSTLTTLWKVDDEATMELMVAFYEALATGESRADALSMAQEKIKQEGTFAHPYYWSALTLYGQSTPLEIRGGNWKYVYFAAGLLALALLGFWWRRNP